MPRHRCRRPPGRVEVFFAPCNAREPGGPPLPVKAPSASSGSSAMPLRLPPGQPVCSPNLCLARWHDSGRPPDLVGSLEMICEKIFAAGRSCPSSRYSIPNRNRLSGPGRCGADSTSRAVGYWGGRHRAGSARSYPGRWRGLIFPGDPAIARHLRIGSHGPGRGGKNL